MLIQSNKSTLIITDTSCLIVLDKIGQLDLLPHLFDVIVTTPEIASEYGKLIPTWLRIVEVSDRGLQQQFAQIVDLGEASAIALAHEIENDFIVTDDLQARKLSIKLGLNTIGTLGILLKAKQIGLINLLKPLLEQIKQTDLELAIHLSKSYYVTRVNNHAATQMASINHFLLSKNIFSALKPAPSAI